MFDIIIAHKESAPGRPILTVTTPEAKDRIVTVIQESWEDVFQVDGLQVFAREVNRGEAPVETPEPKPEVEPEPIAEPDLFEDLSEGEEAEDDSDE